MPSFLSRLMPPLVLTVSLFGAACDRTCITGESTACTCTNGASGAQRCQSDGTYGPCECAGGGGGGGGGSAGTTSGGHPYAGNWSQFTYTASNGYYLGAFVVDSDGNFGAGPDKSVASFTATGKITPTGQLTGTLTWRDGSQGFSGACSTTSYCSGNLSTGSGRVQLNR